MFLRRIICALAALVLLQAAVGARRPVHQPTRYYVLATAFSQRGTTKGGTGTHVGIVAADPHVFPLGTKLELFDAGCYSGTYLVTDTGGAVQGRHLDVFVPSLARARRFGRKHVWAEVLQWGTGEVSPEADASAALSHRRSALSHAADC
jgi:3D (Asp-Asp-Asp) domain-containing protein